MKFLSVVLTIVFLIMQINGTIDWPWYAIISPVLIVLGVKAILFLISVIILLIAAIFIKND